MLKFTANGNRIAFKRLSLVAFAAALCVGILAWAMNTLASTQAPVKDGIPNLASSSFAWLAAGARWTTRCWRRSAPRTTLIISIRIFFRSLKLTNPISDRPQIQGSSDVPSNE